MENHKYIFNNSPGLRSWLTKTGHASTDGKVKETNKSTVVSIHVPVAPKLKKKIEMFHIRLTASKTNNHMIAQWSSGASFPPLSKIIMIENQLN